MEERKTNGLTSFWLHIIAMMFMLCDHLWGTVIPGNDWLTCIGRLSMPIFAFMIVEGYFHTKSLKKYVSRLLVFAVISEIPFNLAMGSRLFYPIHQNILWSFLISIGLIHLNEKVKEKRIWLRIIVGLSTVLAGFISGLVTMVDYYHAGIMTVLTFYFFRERKWWNCIFQIICLWYINTELLGGLGYEINILGKTFFFVRQGIAVFSLVPIWLYHGRQGHHSKVFQYICYFFYPVHLLVLGLIKMI